MLAVLLHKLLFSNGLWKDQSSQKDLKTIVYAKVEGAEYYFYGGFEKRELAITTQRGTDRVQILPQNSPMVQFGKTLTQSKQPFALTRNSD